MNGQITNSLLIRVPVANFSIFLQLQIFIKLN